MLLQGREFGGGREEPTANWSVSKKHLKKEVITWKELHSYAFFLTIYMPLAIFTLRSKYDMCYSYLIIKHVRVILQKTKILKIIKLQLDIYIKINAN